MGRSTLPVLMCALALITGACAGGDDAGGDTNGDGESLADFFGGPNMDDPEAAEAQFREQEMQVQEAIRSCMAEQGFEYVPVQQPEASFATFDESDREEQVREQGFGITTWYGNEDQMAEEATEFEDPNQDYVEGLSDSEREAYYEALHGDPEEDMTEQVDPDTGEEVMVGSGFGSGCDGQAREEAMGDPEAQNALWEELQPAFEQMQERIQADPRMVEANEAYSTCMADRGHEIESREDMWETVHQDFQERMDEIVGPNGGFADPFEGWSEDEIEAFFEEKSQDEIDAFFAEAESESRASIDEEALETLQQEEIDMAVDDFECGKDLDELRQEVSADYEQDIIEEHRDTLEEIRDLQESGA